MKKLSLSLVAILFAINVYVQLSIFGYQSLLSNDLAWDVRFVARVETVEVNW